MPGVITLKDSAGAVLQTLDRELAGGAYTFFVESGGDFIVDVTVETYMPAETPVTVITGEDQTGIDFLLIRQTEVSGTVSYLEGPGENGTVYFLDSEGIELDSSDFSVLGDKTFTFFTPVGGSFALLANTDVGDIIGSYAPTEVEVEVTLFQDVTDIAIELLLWPIPTSAISSGVTPRPKWKSRSPFSRMSPTSPLNFIWPPT